MQVSVGTDAVTLDSAYSAGAGSGPQSILVRNAGASSVWIERNNPDVDSSTGFELEAGAAVSLVLKSSERLYAVADSGTVTVHVLETGV